MDNHGSLSATEKLDFMFGKVANALRWMIVSDTATYALTEALAYLDILVLPVEVVLILRLVINTTAFAIAKYKESNSL